jgi:hypothetical protein
MHYQYPLESLARKRATAHQADFARQAQSMLTDSDEVIFEPLDRGLAIFAAHEEALEHPKKILQHAYGDFVELRGPKVRYMPGEPAHEPIMHVRISARRSHSLAVLWELHRRNARILEECCRGNAFIVRAEAPLASLLGLPARLDEITEGLATHSIRLTRYAPVPTDGDGPFAA